MRRETMFICKGCNVQAKIMLLLLGKSKFI